MILLSLLAGNLLAAGAETDLPKASREALTAVRAAAPLPVDNMSRDVRRLADALDAANEGAFEEENKPLASVAADSLEVLKAQRPTLDKRLAPALDQFERLYRELPRKQYAAEYGSELQRILSEQLRWSAANAKTPEALLADLKEHLKLPDSIPGDADVENLAVFPTDVPLEKWKKLDPIRVFLMKHRLKRPKTHSLTSAADIVGGRHKVVEGVQIEGTVTEVFSAFDQDYCFNIGALHVEMTPEWRILHPSIVKPKVGDRVRLRGWTYYDSFHKAEHEYRPDDPFYGVNRPTLWEIHPVQEVTLLP